RRRFHAQRELGRSRSTLRGARGVREHVLQTRNRFWLLASIGLMLGVFATWCQAAEAAPPQVLFVCEHGNVKSLMAASYFNERAARPPLPFRAISRGLAPDSTSVPDAIRSGLHTDGFDVGDFRPAAVTADDVAASLEVVTIGTDLPADAAAT